MFTRGQAVEAIDRAVREQRGFRQAQVDRNASTSFRVHACPRQNETQAHVARKWNAIERLRPSAMVGPLTSIASASRW